MGIIRRHAIVRGSVQGVGYRMNARAMARQLGVTGRASNLPNGSVEVEVEGTAAAVDDMIAWLRTGPRFAHVDSVIVEESEPVGDTDFVVR